MGITSPGQLNLATIMSTTAYLVLLAIIGIATYLNAGFSHGGVIFFLVVAALAAIPWCFGTRDAAREPSRLQRIFATIWLWFRRLLCFALGAVCLWVVGYTAFSPAGFREVPEPWFVIIFAVCFGIALLIYGVVGGKSKPGQPK